MHQILQMQIAAHWNRGVDGLDAGAFRAKHKTFYLRMKQKESTGQVSWMLGGGAKGRNEDASVLC